MTELCAGKYESRRENGEVPVRTRALSTPAINNGEEDDGRFLFSVRDHKGKNNFKNEFFFNRIYIENFDYKITLILIFYYYI